MRDFCAHVIDRSSKIDASASLSSNEVIAQLMQIKGIGRRAADMILVLRRVRPGVLPAGDLGIVKAVWRAYKPDLRKTL